MKPIDMESESLWPPTHKAKDTVTLESTAKIPSRQRNIRIQNEAKISDAVLFQRFLRRLKRRQSSYPKTPRKNAAKKPPVNWTLDTPAIIIHVHKYILNLIDKTVDQYNRDYPDAPPLNRPILLRNALIITLQINTLYKIGQTYSIATRLANFNNNNDPIAQARLCTAIHLLPCTHPNKHRKPQVIIPIHITKDVTDLLDQSINQHNRDYSDAPAINTSTLAQNALIAILRLNHVFRSGGHQAINAALTQETKRPPNFTLSTDGENNPRGPISLQITTSTNKNNIPNDEQKVP